MKLYCILILPSRLLVLEILQLAYQPCRANLWRLLILVLPVLSLTGLFRAAQSQWSLITPCAGLELPIQSCILLHTVQLLLIRTPDDDCENLHSICTSRRLPAPVCLIVRSFHRRCFHRQAKCFLHGHGRHTQYQGDLGKVWGLTEWSSAKYFCVFYPIYPHVCVMVARRILLTRH